MPLEFEGVISTALLVLAVGVASATTMGITQNSLEATVGKSDVVVRIHITESKMTEFTFLNKQHSCGVVYSGTVVEQAKGAISSNRIKFSSSFRLKTNSDYLVFLRYGDQRIKQAMRNPPKGDELFQSKEFRNCVAELPDLNTDGSSAVLEFLNPELNVGGDSLITTHRIILPPDMPVTILKIENCAADTESNRCSNVLALPVVSWEAIKGTMFSQD